MSQARLGPDLDVVTQYICHKNKINCWFCILVDLFKFRLEYFFAFLTDGNVVLLLTLLSFPTIN